MRKTRRLYNKFCHQSGLPKHYRKSVMSRSLTWGLVRLTTTDIFKPYQKQEHVRLLAVRWDRLANWILSDTPWGAGTPDNILWEQFNRGIAGVSTPEGCVLCALRKRNEIYNLIVKRVIVKRGV